MTAQRQDRAHREAPPSPRWNLLTARPVLAYVLLATALSWLVWVPGLLLAPDMLGLVYLGAFGPAVAGAVMVRAGGGRVRDWLRGMAVFKVRLRWYAVALCLPLVQPVAGAVVAAANGLPVDLGEAAARLPMVVPMFVMMLLVAGGQEEPGWRGYLLPLLQGRVSPLAASLVIGLVWGLWHTPLFALVPEGSPAPSLTLYVPMALAWAVVFTWLYNRSAGSVVLAMLLHAGINTSTVLLPVDETLFDPALAVVVQAVVAGASVLFAAALVGVHGRALGAASPPTAPGASGTPGDGDPRA